MYKVSICTQRLHLHPLGAFFVYALNCIKIGTAIDPCCGSGGMFVQSAKFIQAHSGNRNNISVYGQEANADTWKMAKMNMAIRGIEADFGPHQADTFSNDLHKTLKADFILAIIWSTQLYINILLFIPFLNRKHSYLLKNIGK